VLSPRTRQFLSVSFPSKSMSLLRRRFAEWIRTADRCAGTRNSSSSFFQFSRHLLTTNAQRHTIYALSTPPGKGGVAVIRVSGPDTLTVWRKMARSYKLQKSLKDPIPWKLQRCRIVHPENQSLIDDGLAVYFRGDSFLFEKKIVNIHTDAFATAPYSFTTQPTLELHIHSGRALITALLSALSTFPNLRPAEPGEFTRQALLGGRLDLTQVEGLHDLIEADTEVQRVWALGSAGVSMAI